MALHHRVLLLLYPKDGEGEQVINTSLENAGFLKHLLPGDVVLADRGLNIEDTLHLYGAELKIPAFTKGKPQLSKEDVDNTRQLASVRIHVERLIGLTRQKYTIMQGPIMIPLLKKDDKTGLMAFDKIVHVACALVNLSESIVPKE